MNETLAVISSRKSIRRFTTDQIADADRAAILHAAFLAPTAGNQQLYTILDITDQHLKDSLAVACDNQPFIAEAPLVLVFCADHCKWTDAYRVAGCDPRPPGLGDFLLCTLDATIAAQNAVIAAESLGIGSCYIGDILENREAVVELLQLPPLVVPVVMVVFGHPTPAQADRAHRGRFDARHIVHENTYRRMDAAELRDMFTDRQGGLEFEAYLQRFCKRKYNADFSVEMSRSTAEYLEHWTMQLEDRRRLQVGARPPGRLRRSRRHPRLDAGASGNLRLRRDRHRDWTPPVGRVGGGVDRPQRRRSGRRTARRPQGRPLARARPADVGGR